MAKPAEGILKDNNDGTVSDLENDLQWSLRDSRQELGKWLNWDEANSYVKACNEQSYLGYNDWRLPTKSEVRSLFRAKVEYQTIFLNLPQKKERKVSNYKVGGDSSFWTCETRYDSYAWKCYFPSSKEICVDQTVSTTGTSARLVRDL
ncbi:hypothetical protein UR09_00610 [Candidatus Nitromaritima sp. SCGC AAA799-A02]|nr:hypothetical protein UR09_00610 [Candidatus Nitromaritima sp. SCGC AAA799-A02]